jgi:alanine-synthesizing transaminase
LWTAATVLNGARAVHYPCRPESGFLPDPEEVERLVTPRTRALVVINPNNPTGAVYPRALLESLARVAERHRLVLFSDEIYDQMTYEGVEHVPMATLVHDTLCGTFSGLSKVYRACGYRVGWVSFSGNRETADRYIESVELLSALRLCANVPGQWAVQTAIGGYQSIQDLVRPGGRLFESRQAVIDAAAASEFIDLTPPSGAMYAFPRVRTERLPDFDDQRFALELLEHKHVLVAPGVSFNTSYNDHFRITTLPEPAKIAEVFARIEELLHAWSVADA